MPVNGGFSPSFSGGGNVTGSAMCNRFSSNAGTAEGDTLTIGTDIFEIRNDSPPTGGTVGRNWVTTDGDGGRTILPLAINGTIDPTKIVYKAGGLTEKFKAVSGAPGQFFHIFSADAPGGNLIPSNVATPCSDTMTGGASAWDYATCRGGKTATTPQGFSAPYTVTLIAGVLAQTIKFAFSFAVVGAVVVDMSRPTQNDSWTISGNIVTLTLVGGGPPNIQENDILVCFAWG